MVGARELALRRVAELDQCECGGDEVRWKLSPKLRAESKSALSGSRSLGADAREQRLAGIGSERVEPAGAQPGVALPTATRNGLKSVLRSKTSMPSARLSQPTTAYVTGVIRTSTPTLNT